MEAIVKGIQLLKAATPKSKTINILSTMQLTFDTCAMVANRCG